MCIKRQWPLEAFASARTREMLFDVEIEEVTLGVLLTVWTYVVAMPWGGKRPRAAVSVLGSFVTLSAGRGTARSRQTATKKISSCLVMSVAAR